MRTKLTEEEKKARNRERCRKYYQEHREERIAKQSVYYQEHKEEISAHGSERYAKNRDKILSRNKMYRSAHKEELSAYNTAYYQEHKEEVSAKQAAYYQEHRDDRAAYNAQYYIKNGEKLREYQREVGAIYRKTKKGRACNLVKGYNKRDKQRGFDISRNIDAAWIEENVFSGQRCIYCGEGDWTKLGVDRINNALGHVPENCVPCCGHCNTERRNKYTFEEFVKYKKGEE